MRGYVNTKFGQLHYVREGRGDCVILLGPAGRSSRMFLGDTGLLSLLSDRFDVIAVDMFGSGNSDPLPRDVTYGDLAGCLVEAMDALQISTATVYGLHTGNKIASAMAAEWPDRLANLVICGQSHSLVLSQTERNDAMRTIAGRVRTTHGDEMESSRMRLIEWSMLSQRVLSTWWSQKYLDRLETEDAIAACERAVLDDIQSDKSIADLYMLNFAYDMEADWRRITAPTLIIEVIHHIEEEVYGHQGAQAQQALAGSELVQIRAGGYKMTLEEKADELAELISGFCARKKV